MDSDWLAYVTAWCRLNSMTMSWSFSWRWWRECYARTSHVTKLNKCPPPPQPIQCRSSSASAAHRCPCNCCSFLDDDDARVMMTSPPAEVRSIVISMSVCLSARITRKPHGQSSPNFGICCLWLWLGFSSTALQYVMYFRFCGWRHVFT